MNRDQQLAVYGAGAVAGAAAIYGAFRAVGAASHIEVTHAESVALNHPSRDWMLIPISQKRALVQSAGFYPQFTGWSNGALPYPVTSFAVADGVWHAWYDYAVQLLNNGTLRYVPGANPLEELFRRLQRVSDSVASRSYSLFPVQFSKLADQLQSLLQLSNGLPSWGNLAADSNAGDYALANYAGQVGADEGGDYLTYDEAVTFWDGISIIANDLDAQESVPPPTDETMGYFFSALGHLIANLPETIAAAVAAVTQWAVELITRTVGGATAGVILGILASPLFVMLAAAVGGYFLYRHYDGDGSRLLPAHPPDPTPSCAGRTRASAAACSRARPRFLPRGQSLRSMRRRWPRSRRTA